MCIFITTWVYENSFIEKLKAILKTNGFDFDEYTDSPIKSKLGVPIYFRPTKGMCDCATELGRANYFSEAVDQTDKKITELRKKKWSEAKIKRWLKEHQLNEQKSKKAKEENYQLNGPKNRIKDWLTLFDEILIKNQIKSFGLLLHEYHGNQTIEDFLLKPKVNFCLNKMDESVLGKLEFDVPYETTLLRH